MYNDAFYFIEKFLIEQGIVFSIIISLDFCLPGGRNQVRFYPKPYSELFSG